MARKNDMSKKEIKNLKLQEFNVENFDILEEPVAPTWGIFCTGKSCTATSWGIICG